MIRRLSLRREAGPIAASLAFAEDVAAAPALLHPEELAKAEGYSFPARRNTYVLGRIAAKQALCDWLGEATPADLLIEPGVFGQPVVRSASQMRPRVSISHCADQAAAVAFGEDHPMGVDIERIDAARAEVIRAKSTAAELALIDRLNLTPPEAATLLWTAKESLSKVFATGLMTPLDVYELSEVTVEDGYHVARFHNFAQYRAVGFRRGDLRCAVALPRLTEWLTPLSELAV